MGPKAEFLADLESRTWDKLSLHPVASHTVNIAIGGRSLQGRENKGRLEPIPGLGLEVSG